MPIEVGHTVLLPRALTDHEWDQLVAELRATFRARGKVIAQGGLREWANGNLHACVEPTESGYRLRMGTVKGDAGGINALGAMGVLMAAAVFGSTTLIGGGSDTLFAPLVLGGSGVGAFLTNLVRLPRWAQQRQQQMRHIGTRIGTIMADPSKAAAPVSRAPTETDTPVREPTEEP